MRNLVKKLIIKILRILGLQKGFIVAHASASTNMWLKTFYATYSPNYLEIHPEKTVYEKAPNSIYPGINWKFESYYIRKQDPAFVVKIGNGRIFGKNGAIITPDGKLLSDVSREFVFGQHSALSSFRSGNSKKLKGCAAIIATAGYDVYYHWMFDILPRIDLLRKANLFERIDHFILPPIHLPFQEESLKILGIPESKMIHLDTFKTHFLCEYLFVPSLPSLLGVVNDWTCSFLRNSFLNQFSSIENTSELIYISRKNVNTRRIINEKEILEILKPIGFKEVVLDNLSIISQAHLFSKAKVIIAPHGSALSNIVFCSENTKIIDIFPPSYIVPCFWSISNKVKLDYYYLIGEGKDFDEYDDYWNGFNADIEVNLDDLKKIFTLINLIN